MEQLTIAPQAAVKGFPPPAPSLLSLLKGEKMKEGSDFYTGCGITNFANASQTAFSAPC
jgi:hypothetical protein